MLRIWKPSAPPGQWLEPPLVTAPTAAVIRIIQQGHEAAVTPQTDHYATPNDGTMTVNRQGVEQGLRAVGHAVQALRSSGEA